MSKIISTPPAISVDIRGSDVLEGDNSIFITSDSVNISGVWPAGTNKDKMMRDVVAAIKGNIPNGREVMKYTVSPPIHLDVDDIDWVEKIRRMVDGLMAHAETLEVDEKTEWFAVESFCEAIIKDIDYIIDDFKQRINTKEET